LFWVGAAEKLIKAPNWVIQLEAFIGLGIKLSRSKD
jgi:hypothetical protein